MEDPAVAMLYPSRTVEKLEPAQQLLWAILVMRIDDVLVEAPRALKSERWFRAMRWLRSPSTEENSFRQLCDVFDVNGDRILRGVTARLRLGVPHRRILVLMSTRPGIEGRKAEDEGVEPTPGQIITGEAEPISGDPSHNGGGGEDANEGAERSEGSS